MGNPGTLPRFCDYELQTLTRSGYETNETTSTSPGTDTLSEAEVAGLMRRIDLRVLPMLFLIYVMAFLDR